MAERIHNNPEKENMNNFYFHMPSGIYRVHEKHPEATLAEAMQKSFKKFEPILDNNEDSWPLEDRNLIRTHKTTRDIQSDIDDILEAIPELAERWSYARPYSKDGLEASLEEYVLRPLYIILRDIYTERDLVG